MHVFLAAVAAVCAVNHCSVACLTSLKEVTVSDFGPSGGSKLRCPVSVEPAHLALGTHHLAVGLGSEVCPLLILLCMLVEGHAITCFGFFLLS